MEVHAHSHTERKKWTHYLWEFIMLFLAVFCGFLAENQREHMVEHRREVEYMESMIEDIAADTIMLGTPLSFAEQMPLKFDSLSYLIFNRQFTDSTITAIYRLHIISVNPIFNINFTERTSVQLQNAGGMRLIKNKNASDAIAGYWQSIAMIEGNRDNYEVYRKDLLFFSHRIFSREYFASPISLFDPVFISAPAFITNDPSVLKEYANKVSQLSAVLNYFYKKNVIKHIALGKEVIRIIKKEYHLQ